MMTDEQERHLKGYLELSTVEAIVFPFAQGTENLPCLLITSTAAGWRYTDIITPAGDTKNIATYSLPL
jgi:hypothetical protein